MPGKGGESKSEGRKLLGISSGLFSDFVLFSQVLCDFRLAHGNLTIVLAIRIVQLVKGGFAVIHLPRTF